MSDAEGWFYEDQGRRIGPVSATTISDLIRVGTLTYGRTIWSASLPGWTPIEQTGFGTDLARMGPPPLPGESVTVRPTGNGLAAAVGACMRGYVRFGGRARRSEYWYFHLMFIVVVLLVSFADLGLGLTHQFGSYGPFQMLLSLFLLLPSLAVSFRRLHDVNRSAWWLLLNLVPLLGAILLLVWACTRGTRGPNKYGPDPSVLA